MNSAAKLRKRGIAAIGATALIATSFGPAALAWDNFPQTPSTVETSAGNNGTIGIRDTDVNATDNQGARLVQPGQNEQAIGDVRFTIPNTFVAGDVVELRIYDRSATQTSDGNTNLGNDYKVGFSADPTVSVSEALNDDTVIASDTDGLATGQDASLAGDEVIGNKKQNTENDPVNVWVGTGAAGSLDAMKPGVAPTFNVQRLQGPAGVGYDIIRLTQAGGTATGDPHAKWLISLSDLKVDLGAKVTPGALRVVPFAMNRVGAGYENSDWFYGNVAPNYLVPSGAASAVSMAGREIGIYTVPAYVSPVSVSVTNPSIEQGTVSQNIGEVKITETHPTSFGTGTHKLEISGARIADTQLSDVKITVTNGGTSETVTPTAINVTGGNSAELVFSVSGSDNSKSATYTITGLKLQSSTTGTIEYQVTGGNLDAFMTTAGQGAAIGSVPAESTFAPGLGAPLTIAAPPASVSSPVTASMSGATQLGNGSYDVKVNPGNAAQVGLFSGTEQVSDWSVGTTFVGLNTATANHDYTLTASSTLADGDTVTVASSVFAAFATGDVPATELPGNPGTLGNGTYTIAGTFGTGNLTLVDANGQVVGETGAPVAAGTGTATFVLKAQYGAGNFDIGAGLADFAIGERVRVTGGVASTSASTTTATVTDNSTPALIAGAYNVVKNATTNLWEIQGPGGATVVATSADGLTFVRAGAGNTGSITLSNTVADGSSFTVAGAPTTNGVFVNQKDILAPTQDLLALGTVVANATRIGGNNRYETAVKVAQNAFPNGATNVIIASGENYPDALSASYLSQRMGAPILLVGRNWIPDDTVKALRDLQAQNVYVVGGEAAVSANVANSLRDLPTYTKHNQETEPKATGAKMGLIRIAGGTRYTTNELVNYYAAAWGGNNSIGRTVYKNGEARKYTAILARGDNYPDALAAGVLTAGINDEGTSFNRANALPLILTLPGELTGSAQEQIKRLDVQHMLLVGGRAALTEGVQTAVEDAGLSTHRISGPSADADDRYWTAAAVAEFAMRSSSPSATNEYPGLGFIGNPNAQGVYPVDTTSYLANGLNFPDALTGAPWVGKNGNVLNLVIPNDATAATRDFLTKRAADVDRAVALGLGSAVSTTVLNEANKLASAK